MNWNTIKEKINFEGSLMKRKPYLAIALIAGSFVFSGVLIHKNHKSRQELNDTVRLGCEKRYNEAMEFAGEHNDGELEEMLSREGWCEGSSSEMANQRNELYLTVSNKVRQME